MDNKKQAKYDRLYKQISELLKKSDDTLAHMATINAVLYHKMPGFFWVGFYFLKDGQLVVGPYQGPLACQILEKDKGVCWAVVNGNETMLVPDVEAFPGHIACDSRSKSELVVPVYDSNNNMVAVLDVDSNEPDFFDETDRENLVKIAGLLYR